MARFATYGKIQAFAAADLAALAHTASVTSTVIVPNGTHDYENLNVRKPGPNGGARWVFIEGLFTFGSAENSVITLDLLYSFDGIHFVGKQAAIATLTGDGSTLTQQRVAADQQWIQVAPFDFMLVARNTGTADLADVDTNMVNIYPIVEVWK